MINDRGYNVVDAQAEFDSIDIDKKGSINFEQFVKYCIGKHLE